LQTTLAPHPVKAKPLVSFEEGNQGLCYVTGYDGRPNALCGASGEQGQAPGEAPRSPTA
jgi:hypothetical protein